LFVIVCFLCQRDNPMKSVASFTIQSFFCKILDPKITKLEKIFN
jgi:hypothetical protein